MRIFTVSLLTLKFMFSFSVIIFHPVLPLTDFLMMNVTHSPLTGDPATGAWKKVKCEIHLTLRN